MTEICSHGNSIRVKPLPCFWKTRKPGECLPIRQFIVRCVYIILRHRYNTCGVAVTVQCL